MFCYIPNCAASVFVCMSVAIWGASCGGSVGVRATFYAGETVVCVRSCERNVEGAWKVCKTNVERVPWSSRGYCAEGLWRCV